MSPRGGRRPGAGRKPSGKVRISVRLPEAVAYVLAAEASARGVSKSTVVAGKFAPPLHLHDQDDDCADVGCPWAGTPNELRAEGGSK